ncbi:MarR family transcriptional regulator [Candidatus Frankia alpina]|uniref:MarR family transcriptional regulator n=2 Tax=Candidatus Frankia alpina TaxID=2699483 RepID=A0A4S5D0U5_9ACTN|nr:MarR family transcriptional regulator [Candidatus Frankia alpina]
MDDIDPLVDYREMARLSGLTAGTLRGYKQHGLMPVPDDLSQPARPRWKLSTFKGWMANRPGRGARTDLRRKGERAIDQADRLSRGQ